MLLFFGRLLLGLLLGFLCYKLIENRQQLQDKFEKYLKEYVQTERLKPLWEILLKFWKNTMKVENLKPIQEFIRRTWNDGIKSEHLKPVKEFFQNIVKKD